MKTTLPALLLSLLAPFALHAQTAQLVKDINTIRDFYAASSYPHDFFRYGSRIVFAATTAAAGQELWITDGTAAGTSQLANINPGTASSSPSQFVILNGTLIFNATDNRGQELWMSDGTPAGTRILADISGGSSNPGDRIVFHGKMLFSAYEPVNGRELWITDGTPAGTRFFRDLTPGPRDSDPHSFVQFGDTVYFATSDALWKTDGTEAGTVVVKSGVYARSLVVAGSRIFFMGTAGGTGAEPWVSDGTEAGTLMLADIYAGSEGSMTYTGTALGDRLLFTAYDVQHGSELWISDGTPAGTRMLRDFAPGPNSGMPGPVSAVIGGTAFFIATTPSTGSELWKTDGTEAGTQLVRDIAPGANNGATGPLAVAGNKLFFGASADGKSPVYWMTDGTEAGTRPVNAARQAYASGLPAFIDGFLYFAGDSPLEGTELWRTDGTDAGTSLILNLAQDFAPSSEPANLVAAGDWLYFDAWEGLDGGPVAQESRSLWRTDGTPEGTLKVAEAPSYGIRPSAGHSLFFLKDNDLWMSNGAPETTVPAAAFERRFPGTPTIQYVLGDMILASVGGQLYAAPMGSDAPAVALGPSGFSLVEVAGRVFFVIGDFSRGLRVSDGTLVGTFNAVSNLPAGLGSMVSMGGHAYFSSFSDGVPKLWRTDGTHDGTVVVRTSPGSGFVAAGTKLFFLVDNQLWVTDGTEAGTIMLPAMLAGSFGNSPTIVAAGDRVVFLVNSAATGTEPWVSDGTVEGTRLLLDINPGTFGSGATELTSVDGSVYMSAFDQAHGTEVWVTDGTPEGTRLAADVWPGTSGSFPQRFVRAGERLYFTATTATTGKELWSLALPARLGVQDVRVTESDSGTTTARFTVTLSAPQTRTVTVEYATADGTARAGSDYDAATGTLTFNAGETSKSLDVVVRGDAAPEGEETFFVKLRNAGAPLARTSAVAVIEDNDRSADLSLALDFSSFEFNSVKVNASNQGPSTATNIVPLVTRAPASVGASDGCCPTSVRDLEPGAPPVLVLAYHWFPQQYFTTSVTARERDPEPSNNRVEWTTNGYLAMNALYLTPGSQATVWSVVPFNATTLNVQSTNPAVLSVPASVPIPAGQKIVSFTVHGLSAGSADIRVDPLASNVTILHVNVVAPGTKVRYSGAIDASPDTQAIRFDQPKMITIYRPSTAPYSGRKATGQVTISVNGRPAATATINPELPSQSVSYYAADVGKNSVKLEYSGDENFLPSTGTWEMDVSRGNVTVTEIALRSGSTTTLRVTVAGSPMAGPSGTIKVSEAGVLAPVQATLVSTAPGIAQAEITLQNVSGDTHTLLIEYSGDARYLPAAQSTRLLAPRTRSARH